MQQAAGGTLFFDEIGLVPLPLQSHLLRVLTQGEVRRVGTEQVEDIDLRVLAATSMDVAAQVVSGAFHAEWYEYLAAHRLEVPPLRERPEDIELLAQCFTQALMLKIGQAERPLDAAVVEQLQSWLSGQCARIEDDHRAGADRKRRSFVRGRTSAPPVVEARCCNGILEAVNEAEAVRVTSAGRIVR